LASKLFHKNSIASFLLGAFVINVLKSKKLNLDSGNKSNGFFYLAIISSALTSFTASFFLGSSFFFGFFFFF